MKAGFALVFLVVAACFGADHLPLPDKLIAARTVYVQNDSGNSKLGDAMYRTLADWGRWKVVTSRSEADLIAVLDHKDIFIRNDFILTLIDAKSSEQIWATRRDMAIARASTVPGKLTSELRKRLPPLPQTATAPR